MVESPHKQWLWTGHMLREWHKVSVAIPSSTAVTYASNKGFLAVCYSPILKAKNFLSITVLLDQYICLNIKASAV